MKHFITATLAAAAAFFLLFPSPARAQSNCGPSFMILQILDRYGETVQQTIEVEGNDGLPLQLHLWVNPTTGSWTLTGTRGPVTCVFIDRASGYSGQRIEMFIKGSLTRLGTQPDAPRIKGKANG